MPTLAESLSESLDQERIRRADDILKQPLPDLGEGTPQTDEKPAKGSSLKERVFKSEGMAKWAQETLADPNATRAERFLAGMHVGAEQFQTRWKSEVQAEPHVLAAPGHIANWIMGGPWETFTAGLQAAGVPQPVLKTLQDAAVALPPVMSAGGGGVRPAGAHEVPIEQRLMDIREQYGPSILEGAGLVPKPKPPSPEVARLRQASQIKLEQDAIAGLINLGSTKGEATIRVREAMGRLGPDATVKDVVQESLSPGGAERARLQEATEAAARASAAERLAKAKEAEGKPAPQATAPLTLDELNRLDKQDFSAMPEAERVTLRDRLQGEVQRHIEEGKRLLEDCLKRGVQ